MKISILVVCLFLFSDYLYSQKYIISGTVRDSENRAVEYANIYIKGTTMGTTADLDGKYQLEIDNLNNDTLVCSLVGYKKCEIKIQINSGSNDAIIDFILPEMILQEIEVMASTFTGGDKKGVALSSLDIVKTPGAAADVMLAIQTFPGIQQVGEGAGLFVRGGDVSETVFIIDGAYMYHPYRFESPNGGYFGAISPLLLKGIYFSSGGYGVEHTNSVSGVLAMESNDMVERTKGFISLGLANSGAQFATPLAQDKLSISLSGNYSNSGLMFKLNGHNKEFSSYPITYDLNMNLSYNYANGLVKLFLFKESDELGVSINNPESTAYYHGKNISNLGNLSIRHAWNSSFISTANVAVSTFRQDADLAETDISVKNRLYQANFSSQYAMSDKLYFTAGIDFFNNNEKVEGEFLYSESDWDSTYNVNVNYYSDRIGIYNKCKYTIMPKLNATLGVRWEYESISKNGVFDFRGALNWNFIGNWSFVSSVGKYHQYPDPDNFDKYYGNPNLGLFDAIHYIAGFSNINGDNLFRMEFYYKDYKHLILNDEVLNYTNEGYGYARGIDIFFKKNWKKLNGRISLSLLDTKRKWGDVPYMAPTKFDITCTFTTVMEYKFSKKISAGAKYRYATGSPYTSKLAAYNDKRLHDYNMFDMSLSFLHRFFKNNITTFYVACNNVLGIDNILGYRYSSDYTQRVPIKSSMLRSFYFGIQFSF
jgi:hypothetical protein